MIKEINKQKQKTMSFLLIKMICNIFWLLWRYKFII